MVEIYDSEEEQVEALKAWWKENGRSTIIGAILGIALIVGWNFWKDHRQVETEKASALYGQLLVFTEQDKDDSAIKVAEQLTAQHSSSSYANYARLMQAKLKIKAGDFAAAKTILEGLLKTSDVELQNVARIRLVRVMLATKDYEKGLQLISETDAASSESFSGSYDELTGDLYVALNRLGEARTAYQNAIRAGQGTPLLQFKLDDITAAEIITVAETPAAIEEPTATEESKATEEPKVTE
ncbi:MAG: tetratricopeptide repeat protein [Methylococcaceae bacterium]|nr:tetratricopeptide repeat protein [Methylococcaceae bacterium]